MAISILCPECGVQLGLPDEAAGANVGCPRCGVRMLVPQSTAPAVPSPPPPPPPQPHEEEKPRPHRLERDEVDDEDDDDVPERPRRRKSSSDRPRRKKKQDDSTGLWIGAGVGGGVLVAVAILAFFLAQTPEKKSNSAPPSNVTIVPYGVDPNGPTNGTPINPVGGTMGVPALTRPPLPPGWIEFTHPEEGFRVYVPAQPRDARFGERLRVGQPFKPGEMRSSGYGVEPTPNQPLGCVLVVSLFAPDKRGTFGNLMSRPADTADVKVTDFQIVTWGGRSASEGSGEFTMRFNNNNPPPKISYRVARVQETSDRLYMFSIEREDRMPDALERAAFFDSFIPGR